MENTKLVKESGQFISVCATYTNSTAEKLEISLPGVKIVAKTTPGSERSTLILEITQEDANKPLIRFTHF